MRTRRICVDHLLDATDGDGRHIGSLRPTGAVRNNAPPTGCQEARNGATMASFMEVMAPPNQPPGTGPPAAPAPTPRSPVATGSVLALPAAAGVAVVARRLLADVAERRARLAEQPDVEALHDFRVALRRLRSWLRAFRPELDRAVPNKAERRLRRLARESNDSRDGEVQLAWLRDHAGALPPEARPGLEWLVDRLESRKRMADERFRKRLVRDFERARAALDDALASVATRAGQPGMQAAPEALSLVAASAIRTQLERLRRRLEAVRGPRDDAQAHRARIAGKRLRYLLEPVADVVAGGGQAVVRLKAMQDAFGELHDASVLVESVADGLTTLAAERGERLAAAVRAVGTAPDRMLDRRGRDIELGLLTLATHLHERAARAFADARDAWLGARGEALLAELAALAGRLETQPMPGGVEIERKYLLRALPAEAHGVTPTEIEQGYVPGDHLIERLRHVRENGTERWFRTVKFGKGLVRTELEEEMMPGLFAIMWPLTEGKRVRKRRYVVAEGPLTWEIDEFLDRDLILAEVELPSADTPVELPPWLAPAIVREVTGEDEFANEKLAR
jgi:CHAD domain-containing protein/CYTH domain-containing protein